nr:EC50 protein [Colletotrichum truncatum]KAF6784973.1 EC50 protein [Colletotrichum truncatum]
MQFSKVLYILFPVAALAAPFQTFKVPTMDPNTVAPEVPAIDRRVPQAEDTCTEDLYRKGVVYRHSMSCLLGAPGGLPVNIVKLTARLSHLMKRVDSTSTHLRLDEGLCEGSAGP